jgi:DNA repair protein RecN (Recombination protein N)
LLKRSHQRRLLDAYGGHTDLAAETAKRFKQWRSSRERLQRLQTEADERASRLDLLRFQRDELTALNLHPEELEALEQDHRRLSHLEQLQITGGEILQGLDESEPSVRDMLVRFNDRLVDLQTLDARLGESQEMLDNARIQVDEAIASLRDYLADLDPDPAGLQQVEQRLEAIHDLARKYRVNPAELPDRLLLIEQELERLEHADVTLAELQAESAADWEAYQGLAGQLGERRRQAGLRLGREISQAMQQLGMPGGVFQAEFTPLDQASAGKEGLEQIEFLVSANPGMPLQPLNKVASGGELSRISLAIQVATIRYGTTPTLVFDEVDVGIGGGVAEIVGQMLRRLGSSRQILCVTHLPQVAAQAGHHLLVCKSTRKGLTHTHISTLDEDARIGEIARMLGGVEITEQTLAHAREMVSLAGAQ